MRTTLDIDDDLLAAAKELSRQQGRSVGQVVSALMRKALAGGGLASSPAGQPAAQHTHGFRPFASRGTPVTNHGIDALRDAEGVCVLRALLDVNVLIALLDAAHIGHALAHQWLAANGQAGWASCPITQTGCIRIMSQPAYPGALAVAEVAGRLMEATQHASHQVWPDGVSLLAPGTIDWQHVLGHRQVTDDYLLALAVRHQGCFVSFDARVRLAAVAGAQPSHLVLLAG